MTHEEYADGLMKIAEWWRRHPEIALPHDADEFRYFTARSAEHAAKLARSLGTCEKYFDGGFFHVERSFGRITFRAFFSRDQICERVQVGTCSQPKKVTRTFETGETEEIPVYEWRCPDSLLNKGSRETADQEGRG